MKSRLLLTAAQSWVSAPVRASGACSWLGGWLGGWWVSMHADAHCHQSAAHNTT